MKLLPLVLFFSIVTLSQAQNCANCPCPRIYYPICDAAGNWIANNECLAKCKIKNCPRKYFWRSKICSSKVYFVYISDSYPNRELYACDSTNEFDNFVN